MKGDAGRAAGVCMALIAWNVWEMWGLKMLAVFLIGTTIAWVYGFFASDYLR